MSVTVIAKFNPKAGMGAQIIEAFRIIAPLVHRESGCELYAAHLEQEGDVVLMIERWASRADLDAHALGEPLRRLTALTADLVERPYDVWLLDPVPLGDTAKGTIPHV